MTFESLPCFFIVSVYVIQGYKPSLVLDAARTVVRIEVMREHTRVTRNLGSAPASRRLSTMSARSAGSVIFTAKCSGVKPSSWFV
jgi:hypothetical protein